MSPLIQVDYSAVGSVLCPQTDQVFPLESLATHSKLHSPVAAQSRLNIFRKECARDAPRTTFSI